MSWFKSCAVVMLLSIFFSLHVNSQSTLDCNAGEANTPFVSKIDIKFTRGASYCYEDGILAFFVINAHPQYWIWKGDLSEWNIEISNGTYQASATGSGFGYHERFSFGNIPAGTYTIVCTNTVTGCFTSRNYIIPAINPQAKPIINNINVTEASFCTNDGQIVVDADNPAPGGYFDL